VQEASAPTVGPDARGGPAEVLVLAGRRSGADTLAGQKGLSHRALLPVGGVPMLGRVLTTLGSTPGVGRVTVSIDDASVLDGLALGNGRGRAAEIAVHASKESPAASVLDYLSSMASGRPALVTTADHPLLTSQMIEHFWAAALASRADAAVGMVAGSRLMRRYPESHRSFIPLKGERYTGTNLFAFLTPEASVVAGFWRRMEGQRKKPWKLIAGFGPLVLLQVALRRLDLQAAFQKASTVVGATVAAVEMPFEESAIDVDKPADLELAERILRGRGGDGSDRAASL